MRTETLVIKGAAGIVAIALSVLPCCFIMDNGTASAEVVTLSEGLRLVAGQNRSVKVAQQEEFIAEADADLARSGFFPVISTSLNQTLRAYQPQVILGVQKAPTADKDYFSFSLNVQQLLYDFQGIASRYEASRLVLETRKFDTMRVRNLVALTFVFTYFDILESDKLLSVAQKEIESLEAHLRDAKTLYDNGVITRNDLLQTEVRLSDARQRIFSLKNLRSLQVSRLNTILARPAQADTQVVDSEGEQGRYHETDRENSWRIALGLRPEVRIMDKTLEALGYEEKAIRSEYYPQFFARGAFDFAENSYVTHEENWSLVLGMNMNLFSGGSTRAGLAKVRSRQGQLLEQREKVIDEIRLEIEKYSLDTKNAVEKIAVTKDAVVQAEENRRINRVRYEEGVGTSTEVIDSITLLTLAETNYLRALYEQRRAEAGLIYATGRELTEVYSP